MASRTLLSPAKQTNWNTPEDLFQKLNDRYAFTIDIAADNVNHLCPRYFTENNSFFDIAPGSLQYERMWCNPPYGRDLIKWVKAIFEHCRQGNCMCMMLLPARVDTQWFHKYIYLRPGVQIDFFEGRIKFKNPTTGKSDVPAAFPSMLVLVKPDTMDFKIGGIL